MSKKVTVNIIKQYKANKEKFSVLTAYDCYTAKYLDEAGIDIVLIGDSLAMVALGYENTNSVGIEEMSIFTKAVAKGVNRAFVVTDMPFLSYHTSIEDAVKNCGQMIKFGANGVKIEGGSDYIISVVERLTSVGIPVMGHLGFTPQFLNQLGGYKIQGKTKEAANKILLQAKKLEKAGVFSIVLEMMPEDSAKYITDSLTIPTISCGAGRYCDAQVLVSDDVFGKYPEFKPKFARKYADMGKLIFDSAKKFNDDVKNGKFPDESEVF
ncbi:MAG: 3-methyl-2-oxobutanoate hydroxymethyltransferase [Candidatus Gastranaerophilaceae bacterium]|nr:3-methyl-2-oxobutanoate hydroxymethyltransferase [Candidatus Gastranaerophilaceae bacterium]